MLQRIRRTPGDGNGQKSFQDIGAHIRRLGDNLRFHKLSRDFHFRRHIAHQSPIANLRSSLFVVRRREGGRDFGKSLVFAFALFGPDIVFPSSPFLPIRPWEASPCEYTSPVQF